MIKYDDIRDGLCDLIKERAGLSWLKVYFNHVNNAESDYAWIRLRPVRTDLGFGWFEVKLRVDITFCLHPDGFAEQHHDDYYSIAEKMDMATLHSVKIKDRYIVVQETDSRIFDGLLVWSTILEFSDYWHELPEHDKAELMKHLHLKM